MPLKCPGTLKARNTSEREGIHAQGTDSDKRYVWNGIDFALSALNIMWTTFSWGAAPGYYIPRPWRFGTAAVGEKAQQNKTLLKPDWAA